ncbi:hypothetical protein GOP47_0011331 [Adiantum capillus-veneris]|uniref:Uncharacterized protein n=1 Tax=Adiantum capillus-veneris TaxID=13818 RepID=A0A9D4USL0_ADICA|nr:hypothetical protein GOP47_0011331 [Adiantum capillus-veneris]
MVTLGADAYGFLLFTFRATTASPLRQWSCRADQVKPFFVSRLGFFCGGGLSVFVPYTSGQVIAEQNIPAIATAEEAARDGGRSSVDSDQTIFGTP